MKIEKYRDYNMNNLIEALDGYVNPPKNYAFRNIVLMGGIHPAKPSAPRARAAAYESAMSALAELTEGRK